MMTAATSKYVSSSSPATRTTVDHAQAASVPMETSVSMVASRWRALRSAARWNPLPHHRTTGVASASATHSQPENWSGAIIASNVSGTVSAIATTRRSASGPVASSCRCPASAGLAW